MHKFIRGVAEVYKENRDVDKAASAKAYLRNQFEFFGISTPLRRQLSKQYLAEHQLPGYRELKEIVLELYALPQREFHYFGMELIPLFKKEWKEDIIKLFEKLILTNSWWDTVDYIAPVLVGNYFKLFPDKKITITSDWNNAQNFWLQRSSLLFQKNYKEEMDRSLLAKYILHLSGCKEFFIRKAIGWVLREYARTDPQWVKNFVSRHTLSPLSKREALKRITALPKVGPA
jgi:3-methyladenine DNA glycosylase AlkD